METRNVITTPSKKIREVARSAAKGNWFRLFLGLLIYLAVIEGLGILPTIIANLIPMVGYLRIDGLYYLVNYMFLIGIPIFILVTLPMVCGVPFFLLGYFRDRQTKYGRLFYGFRAYGKVLGLALLIVLKVFLWSLLFVIPGIIAAFRYAMSLYILADHPDYGVNQCIRESKELMKGNKGKLFCLMFSYIGWMLLWYLAAFAIIFVTVVIASLIFYASASAGSVFLGVEMFPGPLLGVLLFAVLLTEVIAIPLLTYLGMGVTAFYEILTGGIVVMEEKQQYVQSNLYARAESRVGAAPGAQAEPQAAAAPESQPEPQAAPEPQPEPHTAAEPEPQAEPQTAAEPEPQPEPQNAAEPGPQPGDEPGQTVE